MNGINYFCYGQFCSADHNIIITAPPTEAIAERDVENVSITGRSGDLILDNDRYKNVSVVFECTAIPADGKTLRETIIDIVESMAPSAGYKRLTTTYDPEHFRMAQVSTGISVKSIAEQAGTFKLSFDCKPQRFLVSHEEPIAMEKASTFWNASKQPARPLITLYGTGSGTLTVGNITVNIFRLTDQITLDCDLMTAYRKVGDAATENKNSDIYAPDFPILLYGENKISWTGGIQKITMIPRGWTL